MTPRLIWPDGTLELPDLAPPYVLTAGYAACQDLKALVDAGRLDRTRGGVQRWVNGAMSQREVRQRQAKVDDVTSFLAKRRLEEADTAYRAAYATFLTTDPLARAAALIARVAAREHPGATWEGLDPALTGCLPSSG